MSPTPYYNNNNNNNNNPYIPLLHESTYNSPMMGSSAAEINDEQPISTPPKLSLFSLPSKQSKLPEGLTPPPNTVATIPFLWEEAPGKPRTISTTNDDPPKSRTVRSLDLPPRLATTASPFNNGNNHCDKLVNNVGEAILPSPTTVLSGPYEGIYASKSLLRSPEKVLVSSKSNKSKGKIKMPLGKLMRKERSPVKFSSWRWESFRDIDGRKLDRTASMKFCSWRWDSFRDLSGGSCDKGGSLVSSFDDLQKSLDAGGNVRKVARKNSFTFGKRTTSGILANMYGSLKQAMPWRSRR